MRPGQGTGWAIGVGVGYALLAACGGRATVSEITPTGGSGGHGGQVATGGNGGQTATGGAGGGCSGCLELQQCWNEQLCVAESVTIPGGYAIDATEVTRSQYESWLATNPTTGGQAAACSWNVSFAPGDACMQSASVCQGAACAQHPQPCVDQCDALAYCSAVGKRLCGKIGGGSDWFDPDDPTQSQWHHACTSGGVNAFTYGNAPATGACNDYLSFGPSTVPVGSLPGCESPLGEYAGVFDLIGNVEEWEDNSSTDGGATDIFQPRGLSFGMGAAMPACASDSYASRDEPADLRGFRCCVP